MCPFTYTGADFYALCSDAMLKAMARTAERLERKVGAFAVSRTNLLIEVRYSPYLVNICGLLPKPIDALNSKPPPDLKVPVPITTQYYIDHLVTPEDVLVEVTQEDFERAHKDLMPSVSEKELEYYRSVQMRFTQQEAVRKIPVRRANNSTAANGDDQLLDGSGDVEGTNKGKGKAKAI
jgi:peroxin-6